MKERCKACNEIIGVIRCKNPITYQIICNGCADEYERMEVVE
jgi:hypothetical protein